MQIKLFEQNNSDRNATNVKTYRAIRHDIVRTKQKSNSNEVHHPDEKINQLRQVINPIFNWGDLSILELFAGNGNLTKIYAEYGEVLAYEKSKKVYEKLTNNTKDCMLVQCRKADSFIEFHQLIALKQKFDIIDLDPYGFPNRFFPDIFLLIEKGILFVTMPKPYVNILNGITAAHLISYYGEQNPSEKNIIERIVLFGLCHWRKVELIDSIDCKSIWRFAFAVEKVKATEYTGVKNR
jgi:tRNA G26 N,N-dimethylase Trm1